MGELTGDLAVPGVPFRGVEVAATVPVGPAVLHPGVPAYGDAQVGRLAVGGCGGGARVGCRGE